MHKALAGGVRLVDRGLARLSLEVWQEQPALLILLFHGLFADRREMESQVAHPMEGLTVSQFRLIVEHFLDAGYHVTTPQEILSGLARHQRYLMITFDDSYYRSRYALPVLEEFQTPALFFISTRHVREEIGYWWDGLYRGRMKQGARLPQIFQEMQWLKQKRVEAIHQYLVAEFSEQALRPAGDVDRPFSPQELAQFARSRWVILGNHTVDHELLTLCTPAEARRQLAQAQEELASMTGVNPLIVAYPNGDYSSDVINCAHDCGIALGVSATPHKNRVNELINANAVMRLGRFNFVNGHHVIEQCRQFRSDLSIYHALRNRRAGQ
jgi:peptidoglycan/xylan/chitin deacetylase (PgdA/CDA1 family)